MTLTAQPRNWTSGPIRKIFHYFQKSAANKLCCLPDFCELDLDRDTVNRQLRVSEDSRTVTHVTRKQPYPDHPQRFNSTCQLLCRNRLMGHCYWEVEWSGRVNVAVSYRGISRTGVSLADCVFGGNGLSWTLMCCDDGYSVCHKSNRNFIPSSFVSNRVAVFMDCPAGNLSFYSVSSDQLIHIHTFKISLFDALYPGFFIGPGSSVCLCTL